MVTIKPNLLVVGQGVPTLRPGSQFQDHLRNEELRHDHVEPNDFPRLSDQRRCGLGDPRLPHDRHRWRAYEQDDHQAATVTKPGVGVAVSDEATHAELQQLQQIELRILPAIMEPLAAQALKDDPAR